MNRALQVKVCGLTCAEDAALAAEAGADLLGFVVHPPSPRHCADLAAACAGVRERAVLVMVGEEAGPMMEVARAAGIRRIQPHAGPARREVVAALLTYGFWVLLPWADEAGQAELPADLYLWEPDPKKTGLAGGSGQTHPMLHPPPGPFLLAGGLDGANLRDRVGALPTAALPDFRGVDAASRLERAPGRKDPAKVRAFLAAARSLSPSVPHLEQP